MGHGFERARQTGALSVGCALAMIGAAFETVGISLKAAAHWPAAFRVIDPAGKVPALQPPDGTGVEARVARRKAVTAGDP